MLPHRTHADESWGTTRAALNASPNLVPIHRQSRSSNGGGHGGRSSLPFLNRVELPIILPRLYGLHHQAATCDAAVSCYIVPEFSQFDIMAARDSAPGAVIPACRISSTRQQHYKLPTSSRELNLPTSQTEPDPPHMAPDMSPGVTAVGSQSATIAKAEAYSPAPDARSFRAARRFLSISGPHFQDSWSYSDLLVDIQFITACRIVLPRQYLWQS